jgi:hypothetical protein
MFPWVSSGFAYSSPSENFLIRHGNSPRRRPIRGNLLVIRANCDLKQPGFVQLLGLIVYRREVDMPVEPVPPAVLGGEAFHMRY